MLQRASTPDDILRRADDDYEEAPWLVTGSPQGWSVNHFASTLQAYAHARQLDWFVGTLLPVLYRSRSVNRRRVLSPDVFVAFAPEIPRESYDVDHEGVPPSFVLEVVSRASVERDTIEKPALYDEMGVLEYAVFGPPIGVEVDVGLGPQARGSSTAAAGNRPIVPPLQGWWREDVAAPLGRWEPDDAGRLWSRVLGLWLAVRDDELGLQNASDRWLRTHTEADAEAHRLRAEIEELRRRLDERNG